MESKEEGERKRPDHGPSGEDKGPAPAQSRSDEANREPKVTTETPEPRPQSGKPDRQALLNAGISALAALMGALIGGLSTYFVAQGNNAASAEEAQISRKQAIYAEYITRLTDLMTTEAAFDDHLRSNFSDLNEYNALHKRLDDTYTGLLHADFVVRVVDTPSLDSLRVSIFDHARVILHTQKNASDEIQGGKSPDQALENADGQYKEMWTLEDSFAKGAKDDLKPSKHKLFFLF
jgi:hypothetical protein